ncbi:conserved domain protein [Bacteroides sp. CAG:530]|nr:conserved domain protein [Bacteroides sp. CAG:530]
MKKNYIMGVIACAALTMTSCSNDEIGGNNTKQGDPIEFGVYLGRDAQGSRGTIITNDNLNNFGVTAYLGMYNEQEFMYNQEVIKSDGSWTYSPVKYWPTMESTEYGEHYISFYAYAPHTTAANNLITLSTSKAHDAVTATISLPTGTNADLTNMVDFVATANHHKFKTNGNEVSDKVTFNLKHEMTRIDLKAKVSENVYGSTAANKTKVVIRSLKLKSGGEFYTKATYTFPGVTKERGMWEEKEKRTPATADLDLQSILKWSGDWTISNTKVIDNNTPSNKGIALESSSPVNLFNTDQYLFLIPAPNETGLTAKSISATITYDIITEDSNLKDGYSKTSATKTVYLPAGIMQQGKAYNLTFTIAVDQVKLDATVADWDTATNSGIDVPYTPDDATPKPATPKP